MREIEFRAYINEAFLQGMVEVKEIDLKYKIVKFENGNKDELRTFDQIKLMQYTGLKDKNGKKIFDGDILEFDFDDIGKQRAFVYWNEKYCAFLLNVISNNFEFAKISDGKFIGNIYDNPELLKGE